MNDHTLHPEIWFRPSPELSLPALLELIENRRMLATPRLGVRDSSHPKGYTTGQQATLRVFDERSAEQLACEVRIESVISKPLEEITESDLKGALPYRGWSEISQDFSFYEKRAVEANEQASIITFSYL